MKQALIAGVLIASVASAEPGIERFGHVELQGSGEATLILVPCLGCDWRSYDEFMARNAHRYRMYAVTWPGMAATELPVVDATSDTPYWDYILAAMRNLIEAENLERPILIGHSAAGPYVIHFAHDHPDLIGGVVSVDAVITNKDTLGFSRAERSAWAEAEMALVRDQHDDEEAWRTLNTRAASSLGRRASFYVDMWLTPPRENVFAYWHDWLKTDVGVMLGEIETPLLSVYAIGDRVEDPEAFKREKTARFAANKASKTVRLAYVPSSGHTIWEYQPEAFDELIAGFVVEIGGN